MSIPVIAFISQKINRKAEKKYYKEMLQKDDKEFLATFPAGKAYLEMIEHMLEEDK